MPNVKPDSNGWAYLQLKRLKLCWFVIAIFCLAGCGVLSIPADIAEYGLVPEADIGEYELASPVKINIQSNIISNHMIVRKDGTLWSMDTNYRKAINRISKSVYLGRSSTEFYGPVEFIKGVKEVVAVSDVIVVLKNDGTVWSWGDSRKRQYGYGDHVNLLGYNTVSESIPRQVLGLPSIKSISSSDGTMLAISAEGGVFRWGQVNVYSLATDWSQDNLINNAVSHNMAPDQFKRIDIHIPQKIPYLKSIVKASSYGHTFLNEKGDVYKLIHPKFQEVMAPFVDEKIGGYLYKLKLPEKAVDIMIHTVLLENGQVWEMPYIDGTMSQKKWQDVVDLILRPLKHIKSLSGVVKIADRVALIESGDIYRWGDIYNIGREWFHLSLNVEIPVFVYKAQKNISFFSRDVIILNSGDIYLGGANGIYSGDLVKRNKDSDSYAFNPVARRNTIKNRTEYQEIKEVRR